MAASNLHALQAALLLPPERLGEVCRRAISFFKINEHIPYIVVFLFRRVTSYIGIYFITK
jgi:hypothetical protein